MRGRPSAGDLWGKRQREAFRSAWREGALFWTRMLARGGRHFASPHCTVASSAMTPRPGIDSPQCRQRTFRVETSSIGQPGRQSSARKILPQFFLLILKLTSARKQDTGICKHPITLERMTGLCRRTRPGGLGFRLIPEAGEGILESYLSLRGPRYVRSKESNIHPRQGREG
jgi:hypothetical protein